MFFRTVLSPASTPRISSSRCPYTPSLPAWAKTYPENKDVKFLADGSATYTHALGLELDLSEKGLGSRSRRFALLVEDLKVKAANIEAGEFTVQC
ncbi:Peroxiredoxin-2C [Hibiscus syriacus]|uniref:glutaredoxin-dependent peroxiredoxin n=1 Tax=Hibiscus syriacus TaxID=106335 RepID=A0A6A3A440_HIBSY|nr:Peroxiredoxin-2C [Hibiscus syriacus]